jgi:hypothetical protein
LDQPATPVTSWRPGPPPDRQDGEDVTARILDVVRMLAMSIGGNDGPTAEDHTDAPPESFRSGVVAKAHRTEDEASPPSSEPVFPLVVRARAVTRESAQEQVAVQSLPPVRARYHAMLDIPLRVVPVEDPARARRRATTRTAASAIFAAFAVFLIAVAAAKPEVLVVRAPRVTVTRLDARTDAHVVKRPSPDLVPVVLAAPQPARSPRFWKPSRGIIRVAPF